MSDFSHDLARFVNAILNTVAVPILDALTTFICWLTRQPNPLKSHAEKSPGETLRSLHLPRSCDGGCGSTDALRWHILPGLHGYRILCDECMRGATLPAGYGVRSFVVMAGR